MPRGERAMALEEFVSSWRRAPAPILSLAKMFYHEALGSPTRLLIMLFLMSKGSASLTEIAKFLGLAPSTIDAHLRKLEELGYIKRRKTIGDELRIISVVVPTDEGLRETRNFVTALKSIIEEIKTQS